MTSASTASLQLNTLGQAAERARHRAELISYFEQHSELLDEDARRRLHSNPLRILDSKNPALQEMILGAPQLIDHLGASRWRISRGVQQVLRDAGQPFAINPRLVRGLDYYNLTVFEWVTDRLGRRGRSVPAVVTTAWCSNWAASRRRPAVSRWASSG
jgi:histidyl-tRNA synthetase